MSHHSYEPSDGGIRVWFQEIDNGLYMLLARLYPIFHDVMHEIDDLISEQATFRGLKFQVLCPKPVEDNPHAM